MTGAETFVIWAGIRSGQQHKCMKIASPLLCLLVLASQALAYVTITTSKLPNGTLQTTYSAAVNANYGCTPYAWSIVSGALPAGVQQKVSSTTTSLKLSGTPTKAASYTFSVEVKGCGRHISTKSYTVVIQKAANHVVDLSWKASTSTDVAGYNVYRSPDATVWKRVNPSLVASTIYSDSTVANSTTYYYAATAVDTSGRESTTTPPVKVVIP
jgi:hypothetical protein